MRFALSWPTFRIWRRRDRSQLVPPVEADHAVDRLGGWARRFFAPVLVSGAALVLVGVIGTASPAFSGMAQSGASPQEAAVGVEAGRDIGAPAAASAAPDEFADASDAAEAPVPAHGGEAAGAASQRAEASADLHAFSSDGGLAGLDAGTDARQTASARTDAAADPLAVADGPLRRRGSIVAALLGRWILAPRSA